MGTFTTEGAKKACDTACRGLGIDTDISKNLKALIPSHKATDWTMEECYNGVPKENKPPAKAFIQEVEKHPGLKEVMFNIEGLISGRSQHASGVIVFPNGYIAQNAMMRTTTKLEVTQFDANDSSFMGGLKLDFLSITSLDRIRTSMDLLLEYGKIEWQGSIRATYNKYFHPDILEMKDTRMFDMLYNGDAIDAFQFDTPVNKIAA